VLRWDLEHNLTVAPEVKTRLRTFLGQRLTKDGELILTSQRFRDQERNRLDCLEKLRSLVLQAAVAPKERRATRPSRGAHEARLRAKHHRAVSKARRGARDSLGE
jgi:ribosome-associated protein